MGDKMEGPLEKGIHLESKSQSKERYITPFLSDIGLQERVVERDTEFQRAPENVRTVASRVKSGNHYDESDMKTTETHLYPETHRLPSGRQPSLDRPIAVTKWLELEEQRKEIDQKMRQLREERATIEARLKAVVVEEEVLTLEQESGHRVTTMDSSEGTGNTPSEQRGESFVEKVTVIVPSPELSGHLSTTTAPVDSCQPPPSPLSLSAKDDQQHPSTVGKEKEEEGEALNSNVKNSSFSTAHLSSHTADTKASASRVASRPRALNRRGSGGMGASVCSDEEYLMDDGDMTDLPPSSTATTRVSAPEPAGERFWEKRPLTEAEMKLGFNDSGERMSKIVAWVLSQ
ncbi:hypothetical protein QBC32DRAFT_139987 [Pseudoneurospora amorphoporcata]|uniref:Uncharacterized protein n=1 Tax=Pseudoneurospora amorphoporcata TaxID=241081 RepID=A0AAN6SGG2_9PEZI|nr:hypothetical protein QBC32DRAFT_139987 [Pseudoneurospora amorphoporcata]